VEGTAPEETGPSSRFRREVDYQKRGRCLSGYDGGRRDGGGGEALRRGDKIQNL